jgi:hypothetical protein
VPDIITSIGRQACILTVAGPTYKMSVGGKIFDFEWHSYCGPIALNKCGDPLRNQPNAFLEAASLWGQQGKRVDEKTGLCIWFAAAHPITQHIGGRHYKVTGWTDPIRGE